MTGWPVIRVWGSDVWMTGFPGILQKFPKTPKSLKFNPYLLISACIFTDQYSSSSATGLISSSNEAFLNQGTGASAVLSAKLQGGGGLVCLCGLSGPILHSKQTEWTQHSWAMLCCIAPCVSSTSLLSWRTCWHQPCIQVNHAKRWQLFQN